MMIQYSKSHQMVPLLHLPRSRVLFFSTLVHLHPSLLNVHVHDHVNHYFDLQHDCGPHAHDWMCTSRDRGRVHVHPPLHALLRDHDHAHVPYDYAHVPYDHALYEHALYEHAPYDHVPYDHGPHARDWMCTFHDRGSAHAHLPLQRQQA